MEDVCSTIFVVRRLSIWSELIERTHTRAVRYMQKHGMEKKCMESILQQSTGFAMAVVMGALCVRAGTEHRV